MRLQNARNLGGGSLICAALAADGDAVYVLRGGATVKLAVSGEDRGTVCFGAAVILPHGRVTREGGTLKYESI